MKAIVKILFGTALAVLPVVSFSQDDADSTGLPGDHFDLQGALELFKNASTPEAFEKALNTQSNYVNNLDLNGDGKIDYVKVVDRADGKNHAIIMRVNVSEDELQDVAAIMLEQTGDKKAQLQIVGDKELYGEEKVVEPYDEVADKKSTGPSSLMAPMHVVVVNVWSWPCVQYIYAPAYVVYVSPWYWDSYPMWWDPWTPYYWHVHYAHVHHYHQHMYHYVPYCSMNNAHTVYMGHRSSSPTVSHRYAVPRANYQAMKANGGKPVNPQKNTQPTKRGEGTKAQSNQPENKTNQPTRHEQQPVQQRENPNVNREPVQRREQPVQRQEQQRQPERVSPPARQPQQRVNPPAQRAPQRVAPPQRQSAPQRMGNPGGGARTRGR